MFKPNMSEFSRLAQKFNRVPVWRELTGTGENPVSAIDKLGLVGKEFVLLESSNGPAGLARYSYVGFDPRLTVKTKHNMFTVKEGDKITVAQGDPYAALKDIMDRFSSERIPGLPEFYGGAMGYLSYDMGRFFEEMPVIAVDDLALPEIYFMLVDKVICFDSQEDKLFIIVNVNPGEFAEPEAGYKWAQEEITDIACRLKAASTLEEIKIKDKAWQQNTVPECNVTKEQFEEMVRQAKEYIKAGDIFQVNLSLRLAQKISVGPFDLYRVLREVNPSPYMCFIDYGDLQIVGSSPELLIRLRDGWAETRPIAGTRRRGGDREEDLALARELINNEKERAEHVMLVDLERNDLGRVCSYGTVEVNELMVIEEYSHVMHIVSNVRGRLAPGRDRFDLLQAVFPGGTITGAPKIRSMEIIEELEPTRRGIYTGSIGFLGYGGEMEMNICIRTIVVKGDMGYVQAGAGIVADSIPEKEFYESMKKAEALLRTMELAGEIFRLKEGA